MNLEVDLEAWVERVPSLLADGLQVVGRQLHLDAGFLDLLCIDVRGRWVVVELKRARLYREVVAQALDYAACLGDLSGRDLRQLIESGVGRLTDRATVLAAVDELLESEADDRRDISIMVAGAGIDSGLERVVGLLASYDLPVRVVSFEVFELADGRQLLVREVLEDDDVTTAPPRAERRSIQDISLLAARAGVRPAFDRIVAAADAAGLFVRPYTRSVMITPSTHKNRFLLALTPDERRGLRINHGPDAFAEFFPELTAQAVLAALGPEGDFWFQGVSAEERAATIARFFAELPEPNADVNAQKADASSVFPFAAEVRAGEWTTYGDLSVAVLGRSSAAMSIGTMASKMDEFPNAHRVLNARGAIPPGWTSPDGGGTEECRRRLDAEGVRFRDDGSAEPAQRVSGQVLAKRVGKDPGNEASPT